MKEICIFSSVDYFNGVPKGAVEVCNYSIIDDYIKAGYKVEVVKIPSKTKIMKFIIESIKLLKKFIFNGIRYKKIVLIYPTIPFAPTTSIQKYYISKMIYKLLYINKKIFDFLILVHILDYPIEQDKGLNISNIKIGHKYLREFEEGLIKNSDFIITYSNAFSEITRNNFKHVSSKIIQLEFSPVRKHIDLNKNKIDITIINFINNFDTTIFYSGDLSREFERNMLSELFCKIGPKTCILLCGNRGEWINEDFKKDNVKYLGFVDSNTHDNIASICSFGIILYPNRGYYKVTPATKLSVYINSLLPIVAIETDTNTSLFKNYQIGECVSEENIISKIISWCNNKTFKNYSLGILETFKIVNSLHDMNKIKSVIERDNNE